MMNMEHYGDLEVIHFDREEIKLVPKREHPCQEWTRNKFGAPDLTDVFRLPLPYMLALGETKLVYTKGSGKYGRGYAESTLPITQEDPWFWCHFLGDPIMPGSQGQDGFMQLIAMWMAASGKAWGRGRALSGQVDYIGQVLPTAERIYYRADIKRFLKKKRMVIADGTLSVDDPENIIYRFGESQLGLFDGKDLGITEPASSYYKPDWEQVKKNCLSWIETAEKYYAHEKASQAAQSSGA